MKIIINFLEKFFQFKRIVEKIEVKKPEIGEIWILIDTNQDPWGRDEITVKVLDVKNNWVKYYMNRTFPDNRVPIKTFIGCYKFTGLKEVI